MLCQTFERKDFEIFFGGSSSTTSVPNFKIMCNCIHELINVFEDSAQHVHTINDTVGELEPSHLVLQVIDIGVCFVSSPCID